MYLWHHLKIGRQLLVLKSANTLKRRLGPNFWLLVLGGLRASKTSPRILEYLNKWIGYSKFLWNQDFI